LPVASVMIAVLMVCRTSKEGVSIRGQRKGPFAQAAFSLDPRRRRCRSEAPFEIQ
jgi:hypothetical protein